LIATLARHGKGVRVWDRHSGKLQRDLPVEGAARAAFSPDGKWLVTGTAREYQFWQVSSWTTGPVIRHDSLYGMAFTRDGTMLALPVFNYAVRLIDPATCREIATLAPANAQIISSIRFSSDGSQLAASAETHTIQVWDLRLIRQRLAEMGLDWDLPAYPPPKDDPSEPLRVEVVNAPPQP
jgi:WD40 repeat protein